MSPTRWAARPERSKPPCTRRCRACEWSSTNRRKTMQTDELRGELSLLAGELEPFEGDVGALHRRQRRRRTFTSALSVALAVALAGSTVAVMRDRDDDTV